MINVESYINPVRIRFGLDSSKKSVQNLVGPNILIFCSERFQRCADGKYIFSNLISQGYTIKFFTKITSNPTLRDLKYCCLELSKSLPDSIIAIGGGSTLDLAKAYKAFISSSLKYEEYCDRLHSSQDLIFKNTIYSVAIPTTSGTGSEVTPFATIWDSDSNKKISINSNELYFTEAIIDPTLTYSLPFIQTLYTSLDALNQAAESIWNNNSNFYTTIFAAHAIKLGLEAIPLLSENNSIDKILREKLSMTSLCSGLSIAHTKTALCHSISYPLTLKYNVPHGLACAFTMPEVFASNLSFNEGFLDLTKNLIGLSSTDELYSQLCNINKLHHISAKIKEYIPTLHHLYTLMPEMYTPERAKNNINPQPDLKNILEKSWDLQ